MMSTQNTFRLDGKEIPFKDGDTVMDAALRAGEYIPHLCHNPDYKPHGSCRICVVAVNGKHQCSCTPNSGHARWQSVVPLLPVVSSTPLFTMPMIALLPLLTIWFGYSGDARMATIIFAETFFFVSRVTT